VKRSAPNSLKKFNSVCEKCKLYAHVYIKKSFIAGRYNTKTTLNYSYRILENEEEVLERAALRCDHVFF
jgi:hypothetical protein